MDLLTELQVQPEQHALCGKVSTLLTTTRQAHKYCRAAIGGRCLRWLVLCIVVSFSIVYYGCLRKATSITLADGSCARAERAGFLRALFPEANTIITYKPRQGQVGAVVVWQDAFDGLVTVISGREEGVLLCLYDYDVDFRLLRIDTKKRTMSLPPGTELRSYLFNSSWEITVGRPDDWAEIVNYLKSVNPKHFKRQSLPVGVRLRDTPTSILKRLTYQHID
jgi:hypothetical protein